MMLSNSQKAVRAAGDLPCGESEVSNAVDAVEAWARFSAAWPFEPAPYRRAAAQAEFEKLTTAEREAAIRRAPRFVKAWRRARSAPPDARRWIKAKGWEAFKSASMDSPLVCRRNNSRGSNL